jgi:hypothetical protein
MGVTSLLPLNPYLEFNKLMEQTMMPETADTQRADAAAHDHASLNSGSPRRDLAFSHTGLWVAEVGNDGTVAYIRDIRRR